MMGGFLKGFYITYHINIIGYKLFWRFLRLLSVATRIYVSPTQCRYITSFSYEVKRKTLRRSSLGHISELTPKNPCQNPPKNPGNPGRGIHEYF